MPISILLAACALGVVSSPLTVALSAHGATQGEEKGRLVVVNQLDHSLVILDPNTRATLGRVSVGVNGHEVVVSKDGKFAYVPIYSNVVVGQVGTNGNHVDVVDLRDFKVLRSIDLGKSVRPHRALFGPDGLLYVTAELDQALYAVDTKTDKVVARIPSGQEQTHMFVISKDGKRAYTANISEGSVSVLDLKKHELIKIIPVSKSVQRISMSVDGHWVFTHDQSEPRVAVIDTKTDEVASWIPLPSGAFTSAVTPDGKTLLILASGAHKVFSWDLKSKQITHKYDLPGGGNFLLVNPSGRHAYVSCIEIGKVAVLNLTTQTMEEPIPSVPGVDGMDWAK
jgi:DNA-binding beta-propeller fold protein YncE